MLNKSFKLCCTDTQYTRVKEYVYAYCLFNSILGPIQAIGVAKCGEKDEFNKNKGRKIARARAELNAYATYRRRLSHYQELLRDKFDVTILNLTSYIDHQKKYIHTIIK